MRPPCSLCLSPTLLPAWGGICPSDTRVLLPIPALSAPHPCCQQPAVTTGVQDVAPPSSLASSLGTTPGRAMQVAMQQRQKLSAKSAKKFAPKSYGSSGATSGLSSSLAFTPIQASSSPHPRDNDPRPSLDNGTPTSS